MHACRACCSERGGSRRKPNKVSNAGRRLKKHANPHWPHPGWLPAWIVCPATYNADYCSQVVQVLLVTPNCYWNNGREDNQPFLKIRMRASPDGEAGCWLDWHIGPSRVRTNIENWFTIVFLGSMTWWKKANPNIGFVLCTVPGSLVYNIAS